MKDSNAPGVGTTSALSPIIARTPAENANMDHDRSMEQFLSELSMASATNYYLRREKKLIQASARAQRAPGRGKLKLAPLGLLVRASN
jgi:hypothetical protein